MWTFKKTIGTLSFQLKIQRFLLLGVPSTQSSAALLLCCPQTTAKAQIKLWSPHVQNHVWFRFTCTPLLFFCVKHFTRAKTALKAERPHLVSLPSFFLCFGLNHSAFNIHEVWKNKHPMTISSAWKCYGFKPQGKQLGSSAKPHFLPVGWKGAPAWQRYFLDTLGFPEQMTGRRGAGALGGCLLRKDKESADMRISIFQYFCNRRYENPFFFPFLRSIYLFIFGCAGSSLLCGLFPLVAASRNYSPLVVHGLLVAVASLVWWLLLSWWLLLFWCVDFSSCSRELSSCGSQAPGRRLSCCDMWA